jgi:branched-subunit amino acid ABC-type transport system permease component
VLPVAAVTKELVVQHAIDAISLGSLYALFALGIALIFGIMRLINFAHGELVMAGAFAVVLIPLPAPVLIPITLVLVVALALAMERIAFRPVRDASAATLLITSFALSFLLQNVAALIWGSTPRATDFAAGLGSTFAVGSIEIQKLDVVTVGVTLALLLALSVFLRATTIGTQMRAAAEDFRTARVLGIRANNVIAAAFALSGLLAGVAAILLTAQTGSVSPTIGVNVVLFAFIATIVGGMGSLPGAVLGGFSIGALTVTLQAALPLEFRPYRDAFVFGAVLAVLVARPQGLMPARSTAAREVPRRASLGGALRRALRPRARARALPAGGEPGRRAPRAVLAETVWPLAALMALTCLVTLLAWTLGPDSLDRVVVGMVINLIVVVGLYTFVGLSGVFSFGHAAFMAIGAYAGAILVIPPETKEFVLPDLPGVLGGLHLDPVPAAIAAGAVAAAVALVLSVPFARLSGLTAGLASFAVLVIVNVVAKNWQQVTHGTAGVAGIPTATTVQGALAWALVAMAAAWALQRSAVGLRLRASREQESAAHSIGIGVARERAVAFVVSAFFVGVAGALLGMFIGSFNPDAFFLNITFLMVVMLVIGGTTSLAGAVIGTIVISAAAELLRRVEGGVDLGVFELAARPGLREVGLALLMLGILILRPSGLTGGRELVWPGRSRRAAGADNERVGLPTQTSHR